MKDREKLKSIFRQIAEGFNLTEGEVAETLKLPTEVLKTALKDCFRQIEQPREKFTAEDYDYLTKEVGCVNLEEELEHTPITSDTTLNQAIMAFIFDAPLKFTKEELVTSMFIHGLLSESATEYILDLLSHPKIKYLIKDGEYYSLNLNAKIG